MSTDEIGQEGIKYSKAITEHSSNTWLWVDEAKPDVSKLVFVDPALEESTAVVAKVEDGKVADFWKYPSTDEGVAAMGAHTAKISEVMGLSPELLTDVERVPGRTLYEIQQELHEMVMRPYRQHFEHIMRGWTQDLLRCIWVKPRRPFKPVKSAKARKRRQQRKHQVYVFITWKQIKWFDPLSKDIK
jgi:hypothetical protein